MIDQAITPEILSAFGGLLITLALSYFPGLNVWFAVQKQEVKRLILLGVLLFVSLAIFGLSCGGLIGWAVCDQAGVLKLGQIFFAALVINQTAYAASPQTRAVKEAKAVRDIVEADQRKRAIKNKPPTR